MSLSGGQKTISLKGHDTVSNPNPLPEVGQLKRVVEEKNSGSGLFRFEKFFARFTFHPIRSENNGIGGFPWDVLLTILIYFISIHYLSNGTFLNSELLIRCSGQTTSLSITYQLSFMIKEWVCYVIDQ